MFIKMFKDTLEALGEDTIENEITALAKVNITFLNMIKIDTEDDEILDTDTTNAVLEFVGYFLEKYGEQTAELRDLFFNGEAAIIQFTSITIATTVQDQVLLKANASFTKKNTFDLNRLKNHFEKLLDTYDDIYIESYGEFNIEDNKIQLSSDFDLFEYDETMDNFLKTCLYSKNTTMFIMCGDDEETMTVFGIHFENNTWTMIDSDELENYMSEDWIEEQEDYGYTNIQFSKLEDKF